jgi:polyhydroxybutyrate depolymerase
MNVHAVKAYPIIAASAVMLGVCAYCSLGTTDLGTNNAGTFQLDSLVSGGITRTFSVFIPSQQSATRTALIGFHGAGGTGAGMRMLMGIERAAEITGSVIVYPDAAGSSAAHTWALGCTNCTSADAAGINDYAFMNDLIKRLVQNYSVDATHVYVAGFSLGGSFAHDIACRAGGVVAGAIVVGAMPSADELPQCKPTRAIPVILILGDADPNVPWAGGGDVAYTSAEQTARMWAAWNSCNGSPELAVLDPASGAPGGAQRTFYSTCSAGSSVRLYRLLNAGRLWPAGFFSASDLITQYFLQ